MILAGDLTPVFSCKENELYSITKKSGFKVAAAGLFIGEHSFSTEETPIAKGRPNYEDLNKAKEFGENIIDAFAV
ncbi:hypothetical protein JMF89_16870 [Clostridiaceae bacterium UIB06]|nr:hypothetical protein [Clostridiaceae bacterium UIB06]